MAQHTGLPRCLTLAPGVEVLEPDDGEEVWYDEKKADFVMDFFSLLCFGSNEWAGKPFVLADWERDAIRQFYGVQTFDDEGRSVRYRRFLYDELPKKNGKSEFAAGLGLLHLLADGETLPIVYIYAADKLNASIIYNAAKYMVEHLDWMCEPKSNPLCWALDSVKEIRSRDGGVLKVMSSEGESKHGYSPSCIIIDELHAQPNRKLWDITSFGSDTSRKQQAVIVLTTAGDDPDRKSIGWEVHEKCRRLLSLRRGEPERELDEDDPDWCPIMYGISILTGDDPDKIAELDIWDEALWYRCNPGLGKNIPLRKLRREARAAKKSEALERLFRWLRLNQWIAVKTVGWVPLTIYDNTQWPYQKEAGRKAPTRAEREALREMLRGKRCYGGLDLSKSTDLTAFVLLFPPQNGLENWVALFWAWRPMDGVLEAEQRDHVPYRDWARAGFLGLCEGDIINYADVENAIFDAAEAYDIVTLGVDPHLSWTLTQRLMDGRMGANGVAIPGSGVNVINIPQGILSMSPPTKELERLIRAHLMLHEHNTCARWCFGNARCYADGNENMKIMKDRSIGRVDITVAWIIAMAAALQDATKKPDLAAAVRRGNYHL